MGAASLAARVLEEVRARPGVTVDELAAVLGWARSIVSRTVIDLRHRKIVQVNEGRVTALSVGPSPRQRKQVWREAPTMKATASERSMRVGVGESTVYDFHSPVVLLELDETDRTPSATCDRGRQVTLRACLEGYTDAMAFRRPEHPCYRCHTGCSRRLQYAGGA